MEKEKTPAAKVKKAAPQKPEENKTLKVEIVSNWSLLEILSDRRKVTKVIVSLLVLVFTIFIGLAFVTISIKRIYPYNDIRVNAFGATTMQNEDSEVIYWLFNTADLWANSGIRVEEGDRLTIRASGRSHTAIHHLVEDAEKNDKLRDRWVGTDGEPDKDSQRDKYRSAYRMFPDRQADALIMRVVPENLQENVRDGDPLFLIPGEYPDSVRIKEDVHFIGKERIDLRINKPGVLHFAVNAIVLSSGVIEKMMIRNDSLIRNAAGLSIGATIPPEDWIKYNNDTETDVCLHFGPHPDGKPLTQGHNEMTYYQKKKYYNAWFDDNVGSFLIVVERRKNKQL